MLLNLSANFVGRENTFKEIETLLHNAIEGKGKVVFLSGEAGIGKSEFMAQVLQGPEFSSLLKKNGVVQAYSICRNVAKDSPVAYSPFFMLFNNLYEQVTEKESGDTKEKVLTFLRKYQDIAPDLLDKIPVVGSYVSLVYKIGALTYPKLMDPKFASLHGEVGNAYAFEQKFLDAISIVAKKQPLVLFLDDIQWADPSSANLIAQLSSQIEKLPVLFIANIRPEDARSEKRPIADVLGKVGVRYNSIQVLEMQNLSVRAIAEYLKHRFSNSGFNEEHAVTKWLFHVSDGNPLFMTEYLEYALAKHVLSEDGQTTENLESLGLPSKSKSILDERIKILDDDTKNILSYASVQGDEFSVYALKAFLTKANNPKVSTMSEILYRARDTYRMVSKLGEQIRMGQQTTVYKFVSKHLRTLLNDSLDFEDRKPILDLMSEIEQQFAETTDNDAEKAFSASNRAAYAQMAKNYIQVARAELDLAKINEKLYAAQEMLQACSAGLAAIEDVKKEKYDQRDVDILEMQLLLLQGRAYDISSKNSRAEDTYKKVLVKARELGEKNIQAQAHNRIGFHTWWRHGGPNQAKKHFDSALDLLLGMGEVADKEAFATAYIGRGFILGRKEKTQSDAREAFEEAMKIYEEIDDPRGMATCYHNIGTTESDDAKALGWYEKAMKKSEEHKLPAYERGNTYAAIAQVWLDRAFAERNADLAQKAIMYCDKSITVQAPVNNSHINWPYFLKYQALNGLGKPEEALRPLLICVQVSASTKDKDMLETSKTEAVKLAQSLGKYQLVDILEREDYQELSTTLS